MNTKIKSSLGLAVLMAMGVVAIMLVMGLFTPQKANAAAPTPGTIVVSPANPGAVATIKIPFKILKEYLLITKFGIPCMMHNK